MLFVFTSLPRRRAVAGCGRQPPFSLLQFARPASSAIVSQRQHDIEVSRLLEASRLRPATRFVIYVFPQLRQ